MQKYVSIESFLESNKNDGLGVTIGNFDGMHLGHKELVGKFVSECKAQKLKSVVISFYPHPREILLGHTGFLLMDEKDKHEQLAQMGVDAIITYPFTRDLSTTSPVDFIKSYLDGHGKTKYLHIGHDFNFGADRKGNIETIKGFYKSIKRDVKVIQEDSFKIDDEVVSSSIIRSYLKNGDLEKVKLLLGRYFYHEGIVEKGDMRGRELGFPTANLFAPDRYTLPQNGVYQTITLYNGTKYRSITNVGVKPTFQAGLGINVENHLFDFSKEIYGETIKVFFVKRLRDERKFESANQLIEQIRQDIKTCLQYFKETPIS